MNVLEELQLALIKKMPFQKKKLEELFCNLDEDLQVFLLEYIHLYADMGISVADIAEAYAMLQRETMKEQMFFSKHRKYRYSTYEEVRSKVYDNPDFMQNYMIGLGLSTVLWPNHSEIYRFFRKFIDNNQQKKGYLEVGAGHGLFCKAAMMKDAWSFYDIVDISETSINLSRNALRKFIGKRNLHFIHRDFLLMEDASYDTVSMGEVLEHVENPAKFIEKCRHMLSLNGRAFITTCLNAPEPDHIYLFSTIAEVENIFTENGFSIEQSIYLPYEGRTVSVCLEEKLPVNVAYILKPC